jgi:mannose-6-phosphate isomerase-like protein (cupin superfamily)
MEKPTVCEGCKVPKGWGEELIIENNNKYCGKLLIFKAGCKFSMHYHMIKDETWYVDKGEFTYKWIDSRSNRTTSQTRRYSKTKTRTTPSIDRINRRSCV